MTRDVVTIVVRPTVEKLLGGYLGRLHVAMSLFPTIRTPQTIDAHALRPCASPRITPMRRRSRRTITTCRGFCLDRNYGSSRYELSHAPARISRFLFSSSSFGVRYHEWLLSAIAESSFRERAFATKYRSVSVRFLLFSYLSLFHFPTPSLSLFPRRDLERERKMRGSRSFIPRRGCEVIISPRDREARSRVRAYTPSAPLIELSARTRARACTRVCVPCARIVDRAIHRSHYRNPSDRCACIVVSLRSLASPPRRFGHPPGDAKNFSRTRRNKENKDTMLRKQPHRNTLNSVVLASG